MAENLVAALLEVEAVAGGDAGLSNLLTRREANYHHSRFLRPARPLRFDGTSANLMPIWLTPY